MNKKPTPTNSLAAQEIEKAEKQFEAFDENIKSLTMDRMNLTKKQETDEPHIAQQDIAKAKDIYLKPIKAIGCRDKFNEKFRAAYEYDKEYVHFIAQNNEIIGESLDVWTRPYAGMPAEEWLVPCNKPVWGPRYLAEQIKRKSYHRLVMQEHKINSSDGMGSYYGTMAADTSIQRLDAHPVNTKKSIFMGALT